MTADEEDLFSNLKDEAHRVFGEDARVYYSSEADDFNLHHCDVTTRPSSRESSFVLNTTALTLALAFKDMLNVLSKLAPRNPITSTSV